MADVRKIIHIDMDAFYASVELKDRPDLKGQPMIVASDHPRAVVTTATYEARQFGLRSAMSVAKAKQLCPHVICIPPDFAKYRTVSLQLHEIFKKHTALIEPISLDEAFLDVTENLQQLPSATAVAEAIRTEIFTTTGLTASAGVAPNKFIAKIASDWNKPNGICIVKPSQIQAFIHNLALEKIPGVGKVTLQKLHELKCYKISDLQVYDENFLNFHFGKFGKRLYLYARGMDDRPVNSERERQQISKEITFSHDLKLEQLTEIWHQLAEQVWITSQHKNVSARGIQVKLKNKQFKVFQHSRSFYHPFNTITEFKEALFVLLTEFGSFSDQYRLAGVGMFNFVEDTQKKQLSFF